MEHASKQELSQQLREQIVDASALVLIDYSGMKVSEVTELRNKFREAGCTYKVYKNSTIRFAVKDTSHEPLSELLKGMTGLAFNLEDPGAPARIARDVAKDVKALDIKGGIMEGNLLDEAGVVVRRAWRLLPRGLRRERRCAARARGDEHRDVLRAVRAL